MSELFASANFLDYWAGQFYKLGQNIGYAPLEGEKVAAAGEPAYNLTGLLYLTKHKDKDWGMLSVPNALVRGVFDAMSEPGIELPVSDGKLNAHITVFRPEDIEKVGGPDKFNNDRGKPFRYTISRLVGFKPAGWQDMERCWVLRVHSPELQQLRRSYGLSSLPADGKFDFHITVATRKSGVLGRNEKAKETAAA
jgi:hypothetical protein